MTYLTENGVKNMIPVPAGLSWSRALIREKKNEVYTKAPYVDGDNESAYWHTVYDPLHKGRRVWE